MPKNKIQDVRNLLIQGMEELLNPEPDSTFDTQKAKALASLGAVIVNSAKAETDFLKLTGGEGSGFIPLDETSQVKAIKEADNKIN